jgi:hypothetical protein
MPTPRIYVGEAAPPLFTGPTPSTTSIDLLYLTDRAPMTKPDGSLGYSSDRSRSMAFGSVTVEIGEKVPWPILAKESVASDRDGCSNCAAATRLNPGASRPSPLGRLGAGGITGSASSSMRTSRRAGASRPKWRGALQPALKEVIFVHGYAKPSTRPFRDIYATSLLFGCSSYGDLPRLAGGSRGLMAGYNVDQNPASSPRSI